VTRPYSASGGNLDSDGNPVVSRAAFRFTGQRIDDGSGLLYFAARYYDPALGMFTTLDPARQFSSPYSYSGASPLNGTDPSGTWWGDDNEGDPSDGDGNVSPSDDDTEDNTTEEQDTPGDTPGGTGGANPSTPQVTDPDRTESNQQAGDAGGPLSPYRRAGGAGIVASFLCNSRARAPVARCRRAR
jgi:RHS repeat-associated protein